MPRVAKQRRIRRKARKARKMARFRAILEIMREDVWDSLMDEPAVFPRLMTVRPMPGSSGPAELL